MRESQWDSKTSTFYQDHLVLWPENLPAENVTYCYTAQDPSRDVVPVACWLSKSHFCSHTVSKMVFLPSEVPSWLVHND